MTLPHHDPRLGSAPDAAAELGPPAASACFGPALERLAGCLSDLDEDLAEGRCRMTDDQVEALVQVAERLRSVLGRL